MVPESIIKLSKTQLVALEIVVGEAIQDAKNSSMQFKGQWLQTLTAIHKRIQQAKTKTG